MQVRPLRDHILAKRLPEETTTTGGLIIPDTAKERPLQATIIAIGSGKITDSGVRQAPTVKAGDKILIGKYSGSDVKLDGEDHIILREEDILAILDS